MSSAEQTYDGSIAAQLRGLDQYEGSRANRTYLSLKDAIMSLVYRPGEILRKSEICEVLGVSRSPVSEAIAKLAAEGLVDVVPQAGTFVSRFSWSEIREGAFLREALELAAVERIAPLIDDQQIALLNRNLRVQKAHVGDGDFAGFYQMDAAMHALILSFTGFKRLAHIAETSWLQVDRARQLILPSPGRVEETLVEHEAIVVALAAQDTAAACKATRYHLRQLIKLLDPLERQHPEFFKTS